MGLQLRKSEAIAATVIFVGVALRLYGLDPPPFEHHWWRGYENAAIARNFYEGTMNLFYPQVDWGGASAGYVESEFPIYPFLVATLYHVIGPEEWIGVALNIAFYAVAALLLFGLTRRLFDDRVAVLSVLFYSVIPMSFYMARSFHGDVLLSLCSIAGIYYFWMWTDTGRRVCLALSAIGISLAVLIKPLSVYLLVPLLYLCHRKYGLGMFRKTALWLFGLVVFVPSILWYLHAWHVWQTYGNTLFRGYLGMGIPPPTDGRWLSLAKRLFFRIELLIATPPGMLFLIIGFFSNPPRRNYLLHWWTSAFGCSVLLAMEANRLHDYYLLPMVFVIVVYMAFGITVLWERQVLSRGVLAILCVAIVGFSAWRTIDTLRISESQKARVRFGKEVESITEADARVVFVTPRMPWRLDWYQHRTPEGEYLYHDPVDFYLSHRKGWSVGEDQVSEKVLEFVRKNGARYFATFFPNIFIRRPGLKTLLENCYIPVRYTSRWSVYRLEKKEKGKCVSKMAEPSPDHRRDERHTGG